MYLSLFVTKYRNMEYSNRPRALISIVPVLVVLSLSSTQTCEIGGIPLQTGSCDFSSDSCGYTLDGYWKRGTGKFKRGFFSSYYLESAQKTANTSGGYFVHFDPYGHDVDHHSQGNIMTSPMVSPGSYCFSFWFVKTSNQSGLTVSVQPDQGPVRIAWNNTSGVSAHVWKQTTLKIQSSESFKITFHSVGCGTYQMVGIDDTEIVLLGPSLVPPVTHSSETYTLVTWNCTFLHNDTCNMTYNGLWGVQSGPFLIQGHPVIRGGYDDDSYAWFDPYHSVNAEGQYTMASQWFPAGTYNLTFWHFLRSPVSKLEVNTVSGSLLNLTGRESGWQLTELMLDEHQPFQIQFSSTRGSASSAFVGIDDIVLSGTTILTTIKADYVTTTATTITTERLLDNSIKVSRKITPLTSEATITPPPSWTEPTTEDDGLSTEKHPTFASIETTRSSLCATGFCLEDAINHSCSTSHWNVTVNLTLLNSMYPHAGENNIYLGDGPCLGQVIGDYLIFDYGLHECLTSEKISNNKRIYENNLMYVVFDPLFPFLIRQHKWTFSVECDVTRDGSSSSHVHHDVEYHHETANSSYQISLKFYRDPNFHDEIPGNPLHVNVGDNVYVKVFTNTADQSVKLRLNTCFTTPSSNAPVTMKYYIIQDGCETDRNTHIISQSSHETTFVFQDFEYISNREGLDLSCSATFCDSSDYSAKCRQSCNMAGPSVIG